MGRPTDSNGASDSVSRRNTAPETQRPNGSAQHGRALTGRVRRRSSAGASPIDAPGEGRGRLPPVRLILADPDPLARRAFRDALPPAEGLVVVAEAADGVEAIELALHYHPEVLVTEIGLPRLDGVEVCRRVTEQAPGVSVVMFSIPQPKEVEVAALRAGASGFLSKTSRVDATARAIRSVAGGDAALSRSSTMHLIELLRATPVDGIGTRPVRSSLSTREWEVLDLICGGASTSEIARTLFVSEGTVYTHTKHIYRKLGVRSRREAVVVAGEIRRQVG